MNYLVDTFNTIGPHQPGVKVQSWKFITVVLLLLGIISLFLFKIFELQVLKRDVYAKKSEDNFNKRYSVLPERGIIYSRENNYIVQNMPLFAVVVSLNNLNRFSVYTNINEIFSGKELNFLRKNKIPLPEDFIEEINKDLIFGKEYFFLKRSFDKEEYINLQSDLADVKKNSDGYYTLDIVSKSYRYYPENEAFSHLLGYVGDVSKEDLDRDSWYTADSKVGRAGLEKYYEEYLRGDKGVTLKSYDSKSRIYSSEELEKAKHGASILTTINYDLQKSAYASLKEKIEKLNSEPTKYSDISGGAVVVQNPNTGEVLALVSYPSYDNLLFSKGIKSASYQSYLEDVNKPLFNRALSMAFPPASTFKIITATAGLQEGSLNNDMYFDDSGVIRVGDFSYKTWKAGGHGVINLVDALRESSDTFFYVLGGGHVNYPEIKPLGPWKLYKWSRIFGLGETLGIDLPEEISGFVPTPEWKEKALGEPWYVGNTYHFSIGQGFVTATPLQVNSIISAVANGGKIYKPFIVKEITDSSTLQSIKKSEPQILSDLMLNAETVKIVREGLLAAVKPGGTAYPLFDYPVSVSGKTGTAEYGEADKNGRLKTHAWFTAFAPSDNPEIALTVFIENGGSGADNAVPVAKEILDSYFDFDKE